MRAFFKGNGTNVVKIAPETAIKLTLNDALKQVGRQGRPVCHPPGIARPAVAARLSASCATQQSQSRTTAAAAAHNRTQQNSLSAEMLFAFCHACRW